MIKLVNELNKKEIEGKKILLRVDFDVPIVDGKIEEDFRIKTQMPTVEYLLNNGAKVLLLAHLGHDAPGLSFLPITEQLGEILSHTLTLVPHDELSSIDDLFKVSKILLLENLRQDPGEIANDESFAKKISADFDYYVNEAFATSHRKHASISAITKILPSYAGLNLDKEIKNLEYVIESPAEEKVVVLGGAKISTKLPVIKNLINKSKNILIGGALANNFFKYAGIKIGKSLVDDDVNLDFKSDKVLLPTDILISKDKTGKSITNVVPLQDIDPDFAILDIGPQSSKNFADIIKNSKTVVWNGPMGLSEVEIFSKGTRVVAEAVSGVSKSIIGGGDTISAVDKLKMIDKFGFVSTGGGAMLDFLAGEKLPGLEALGYYN